MSFFDHDDHNAQPSSPSNNSSGSNFNASVDYYNSPGYIDYYNPSNPPANYALTYDTNFNYNDKPTNEYSYNSPVDYASTWDNLPYFYREALSDDDFRMFNNLILVYTTSRQRWDDETHNLQEKKRGLPQNLLYPLSMASVADNKTQRFQHPIIF
ncbi:hypothetical protein ACFE04_005177 [Oxalis oulophora]